MKAITVEPKKPGTARLEDIPEPDPREGPVLVEAIAVGVCGTDVEIVEGKYGWSPPGKTRLVLGHESLGRVLDPGPVGGLVVGVGFEPDVIIECTGVGQVIVDALQTVAAGGGVCLTGVGSGGSTHTLPTADMAAVAVLKNEVIVGSVNANKRHWYKAGEALARADRTWLGRLVTRRERPENFAQALERKPDDIKVVIQFSEA
jgi:threonine dehydrogenase-like Zn-dependent dehydrogenase